MCRRNSQNAMRMGLEIRGESIVTSFWKRDADLRRWPAEKAGYRHFDEHRTWGALQSMSLAMFERARGETMDWKQSLPIRNPESYAWFALTLAIQLVVGSVRLRNILLQGELD